MEGGFISFIIGVVLLFVFFAMAYRISKIREALEILVNCKSAMPENKKDIKCEMCGKEFKVSILRKGYLVNCPKCKTSIRA